MRFCINKSNIDAAAVSSRGTQSLFINVRLSAGLYDMLSFVAEAGLEPALIQGISVRHCYATCSPNLFRCWLHHLPAFSASAVSPAVTYLVCHDLIVPRRFPVCPLTFPCARALSYFAFLGNRGAPLSIRMASRPQGQQASGRRNYHLASVPPMVPQCSFARRPLSELLCCEA